MRDDTRRNTVDDTASVPRVWGVSALLLASNDLLAARFGALTVVGELSGFSRAGSGHCYFSLKDGEGSAALLRCAMFRRAALMTLFQPADGQQVEVRGRLAVYEARGELQMVVEAMRRVGDGALYEAFLRLKARLVAEGLLDAARKRTLPRVPAAVGVVTSLAGAALQDVLAVLARRAPYVRVVIYPCVVQGIDAPSTLLAALAAANARAEVDVLIVCRGGGSMEDLAAFNDEGVVRAVAASALPVVCAIGHETDVTLAELASDLRAATPSAAAELVCEPRTALADALQGWAVAMARRVSHRLETQAQDLDALALRLGRPARGLAHQQQRLWWFRSRLDSAMRGRLESHQRTLRSLIARHRRVSVGHLVDRHAQLARLASALNALNPSGVLQRGYAWIEGPDGRPITTVTSLKEGMQLEAVWHDGRAAAQIGKVVPSTPGEAPPARTRTTRKPAEPRPVSP